MQIIVAIHNWQRVMIIVMNSVDFGTKILQIDEKTINGFQIRVFDNHWGSRVMPGKHWRFLWGSFSCAHPECLLLRGKAHHMMSVFILKTGSFYVIGYPKS